VNVDSPEPKQVDQVRADLLAAIVDARSGKRDLSNRLQSQSAQKRLPIQRVELWVILDEITKATALE
jgi:hypothetical protein